MEVDKFLQEVKKSEFELPDDFSLEDIKKEAFDFLKYNKCEIFPYPSKIPENKIEWVNCNFSIKNLFIINNEVSKTIFYDETKKEFIKNENNNLIEDDKDEELDIIRFGWIYNDIFYSIVYFKPEEENKEPEIIPEDKICVRCKQKAKSFNDINYCSTCINELTQIAQTRSLEIKEELKKNNLFISLTSQDKAVAYVKDKYSKEVSENRFIFPKQLAIETYNLLKIMKN